MADWLLLPDHVVHALPICDGLCFSHRVVYGEWFRFPVLISPVARKAEEQCRKLEIKLEGLHCSRHLVANGCEGND